MTALTALRDEGGADDALATALHALASRVPFDGIEDRLAGLVNEIADLAVELRATAEAIEDDPGRLAEIRVRRQLLRDLCRKYGHDVAGVMAFHAEAEDRLRELQRYDQRAAELDRARTGALAVVARAAAAVGAARRAAAPVLAAAVERRLRDLAMPNASVVIDVGAADPADPGDDVTFLLSANPGSPALSLARVASGGELARAMLALRLVLVGAGADGAASTLVFDEVDAGIGGEAAVAVADALASLGQQHQVLVVTHLPQVAAAATAHMAVAKAVTDGETFATVAEVTGDDRVAEVARMLSGGNSTVAREHAKDLLASSTR